MGIAYSSGRKGDTMSATPRRFVNPLGYDNVDDQAWCNRAHATKGEPMSPSPRSYLRLGCSLRFDSNQTCDEAECALNTFDEAKAALEEAYHELRVRCGYPAGFHAYDYIKAVLAKMEGTNDPD